MAPYAGDQILATIERVIATGPSPTLFGPSNSLGALTLILSALGLVYGMRKSRRFPMSLVKEC